MFRAEWVGLLQFSFVIHFIDNKTHHLHEFTFHRGVVGCIGFGAGFVAADVGEAGRFELLSEFSILALRVRWGISTLGEGADGDVGAPGAGGIVALRATKRGALRDIFPCRYERLPAFKPTSWVLIPPEHWRGIVPKESGWRD